MHCSPSGSSVHGDCPGKNIEVGCHDLLQGIFPTQGSNPGLPHCRWSLYHLSHQASPKCQTRGEIKYLFLITNHILIESVLRGLVKLFWFYFLKVNKNKNIVLCMRFVNCFQPSGVSAQTGIPQASSFFLEGVGSGEGAALGLHQCTSFL